jgi:hypothetical protein
MGGGVKGADMTVGVTQEPQHLPIVSTLRTADRETEASSAFFEWYKAKAQSKRKPSRRRPGQAVKVPPLRSYPRPGRRWSGAVRFRPHGLQDRIGVALDHVEEGPLGRAVAALPVAQGRHGEPEAARELVLRQPEPATQFGYVNRMGAMFEDTARGAPGMGRSFFSPCLMLANALMVLPRQFR